MRDTKLLPNWYVPIMEKRLSEEDKAFLKEIYEPTAVSAGFSTAWHGLAVMPDGEIRLYDDRKGKPIYLSSGDCGLSWKLHKGDPQAMPAALRNPKTGRYIGVGLASANSAVDDNRVICYTDGDPDGHDFTIVPVDALGHDCMKPPVFLQAADRVIIPCNHDRHGAVLLSDDDGASWRLVDIEPTDHFVQTPPHEGMRWENSGLEPTVVELADGTLLCYLRTSTDFHYVTRSYDHGDTWTKPEPTPFHSVLTFPNLFRLNDGRILFFFNNTKPLPEVDHRSYFPPLGEDVITGVWEDVFTNRDAMHIAVSDDEAKTWRGFRELQLNDLRNTCDFRSSGGNDGVNDKSVHQSQVLELPYGKILVHNGQHPNVNKVLIFDINWLYEQGRRETLSHGLGALSTQVYLQSVSGGICPPFPGHCAWNRTNGVIPVPDPSGDHSEVLLFRNPGDDRLFNQIQGAVWNFPATHHGEVSVKLRVLGDGLRISLLDYWMNPCDPTVGSCAAFSADICEKTADWVTVTLQFDTDRRTAQMLWNGKKICSLPMRGEAPHGLYYLHLQTVAASGDRLGSLVKEFYENAT